MVSLQKFLPVAFMLCSFSSNVWAQSGPGGGGARGFVGGAVGGPNSAMGMRGGVTSSAQTSTAGTISGQSELSTQTSNASSTMGQQTGPSRMPSIEQLASMMMSSCDTDSSGALDESELQTALAGLRSMMMQQQMSQQMQQNASSSNQAGIPAAGGLRNSGQPRAMVQPPNNSAGLSNRGNSTMQRSGRR